MPGRKDRKEERNKKSPRGKRESGGGGGAGGGGLASMFGLGMDPALDVSDADLEAELLALEGKAPKKGGKSPKGGRGMMSIADLDKVMADADKIGEDDDEELSDIDDDDELLGELKALEQEEDEPEEMEATPPKPTPRKALPPSSGQSQSSASVASRASGGSSGSGGGGAVGAVSERLDLYRRAIQGAEAAGESSKVRRYKRSVTTLEQMLKSAKAGKYVNLEDMPPPVNVKEAAPPTEETTPTPAPKPRPSPSKPPPKVAGSNLIDLDDPEFDEFNLTDEEIAAMAMSMVDDRQGTSSSVGASVKSQSSPSVGASHPGSKVPGSAVAESQSSPNVAVSRGSSASKSIPPPQPKPRSSPPKPKPHPTPQSNPPSLSMKSDGRLDLDAPEFDEFNLTDEDLEAMAAMMVDDREAKKPKLDTASSSPANSLRSPQQKQPLPPQTTPTQGPAVGRQPPPPSRPATQSLPPTLKQPVSGSSEKSVLLSFLTERKEQYQRAALNDAARNKEFRVIAAKFARIVKGVESGQDIDLSQMPGPPPGFTSSFNIDLKKYSTPSTSSAASKPATPPTQGQSSAEAEEPEVGPNPDIPVPKTALEALEQRLAKYNEGLKTAQEKGESSRVRRMGRIIKQYETAIKNTRAGKLCDYSELPTPPGFPPIPAPPRKTASMGAVAGVGAPRQVPLPTQSLPVMNQAAAQRAVTPSISQQQIQFVQRRMTELKQAARLEQQKNNKEGALEYMKRVKGLETMLKAAEGGLPVNLEQVPPSPFADVDKTKPSSDVLSHLRPAEEKDTATFELIIKQLEKQLAICEKNAETYKKMGSNASAIEYENMAQNCKRELLALKGIQSGGYGPPRFTLETRTLTMIHSNAHLNSSTCEVEVTKVINLTRPPKYEEKDMDVYVEVEFPYPVDSPPKKNTEVVHKTSSPEFKEQTLLFDIDRKHHRSMSRAFKRSPLKCTVWQHRSLRKHIFLGQAGIPLESLETKSELHSTLDLLDERGRKPVGGKIEVFVRLREPLTGRDQEVCEEQWLVFQEAIASKSTVPMPKPVSPTKKGGGAGGGATPNYALLSPVKVESTTSVAALKFEFSLVSSAIKGGHKDGQTVQKGKLVKAKMDSIQQRLQTDPKFRQLYPRQVAKEMQQEKQLEEALAKQGKSKQAEVVILQKRRAAMEKEIKEMR